MAASKSGTILMVIAPEQFRDEELLVPQQVFQESGYTVKLACSRLGQAKGMLGEICRPDILLKDAQPGDYEAVVVVGGMGSPQYLWDDQDLHSICREVLAAGQPVAAICLSGAVLAKAGLLKGKKATVWPMPESLQAFKAGSVQYLEQPVVQDGLVVTANGPEAAGEFARTIVKQLKSTAAARI